MTPHEKPKRWWLAALLLIPAWFGLWLGSLGWTGGAERELPHRSESARWTAEGARSLEPAATLPAEEPDAAAAMPAVPSDPPPARREAVETLSSHLVVTVLDSIAQQPVSGAMVSVRWAKMRRWEQVEGPVGELGEAPLTDESGVATLEVPAHRALDLDVIAHSGSFRRESRVVDSLEPGEERRLTITVEPKTHGVFYGRVVAAESRAPIGGAELRFPGYLGRNVPIGPPPEVALPPPAATSGTDGCFDLPYNSACANRFHVTAEGRLLELVNLYGLETTPTERYEVQLTGAARLEGIVRGRPAGVGKLRVRVGREGAYGAEWIVPVDASGAFALDSLPAGVPLLAEVVHLVEDRERARGGVVDYSFVHWSSDRVLSHLPEKAIFLHRRVGARRERWCRHARRRHARDGRAGGRAGGPAARSPRRVRRGAGLRHLRRRGQGRRGLRRGPLQRPSRDGVVRPRRELPRRAAAAGTLRGERARGSRGGAPDLRDGRGRERNDGARARAGHAGPGPAAGERGRGARPRRVPSLGR